MRKFNFWLGAILSFVGSLSDSLANLIRKISGLDPLSGIFTYLGILALWVLGGLLIINLILVLAKKLSWNVLAKNVGAAIAGIILGLILGFILLFAGFSQGTFGL